MWSPWDYHNNLKPCKNTEGVRGEEPLIIGNFMSFPFINASELAKNLGINEILNIIAEKKKMGCKLECLRLIFLYNGS